MANIIYRIGQEKDIVRELDNYNDSIFKDQYENALKLVSLFLEDIDNPMLKAISFCGERGDGKTSCMISVLELLKKGNVIGSPQHEFLISKKYDIITNIKFAALDLIDPSFFDESHNVIELVVGQMYGRFKEIENSEKYDIRNKLLTAFQEIKRYLCVLHDKNLDAISSIHELDILSSTIALRSRFENLVKLYLNYVGKDTLVIPIDDIDLNISQAYKMCEQIRKYLAVSKCIVLLAVKTDQLQSIIANTFQSFGVNASDQRDTGANNDDYDVMAEKYIMKFLPTSARIFMPKVYNFINSNIEIRQGNQVLLTSRPMKDAVVDLIFRTTRYLFYNLQGNISPIVPNNLREFFLLIGLLSTMKQISNSRDKAYKDILESNKNKFKQYFFNVWKGHLANDVQKQIDKLVNFDFGTSLNKEVVSILAIYFKLGLEKDYDQPKSEDFEIDGDEEASSQKTDAQKAKGVTAESKSPSRQLIESIKSNNNFGYNVSVGDVFYLLSNLEKETLNEDKYALIFFLKSFYSIKIYEAYDEVTEHQGQIYPKTDSGHEALSVIDHRFDFVNKLQQIISGSYFTYVPGDLISPTQDNKTVDLRLLSGKDLNTLLSALKRDIDTHCDEKYETASDEQKHEIDRFNLRLNLAEFFILTIKCAVRQKEFIRNQDLSATINKMRANVDPFYYRKYTPYTGYYIFDVMAPFATIVNPEYAYRRFSIIDEDFYNKIRKQKGSLLNKMIDKCHRDHVDHDEKDKEWTKLHKLLSDSVIRNADVLTTVKDNIVLKRSTSHDKAYLTLSNFYKDIESSELATHKTSDDDKSYPISFHFLEPLQDFIKIVIFPRIEEKLPEEKKEDTELYSEVRSLFNNIYGLESTKDEKTPIPNLKELKEIVKSSLVPTTVRERLLSSKFGTAFKNEIKSVFDTDAGANATYESQAKRNDKLNEMINLIYRNLNPVGDSTESPEPQQVSIPVESPSVENVATSESEETEQPGGPESSENLSPSDACEPTSAEGEDSGETDIRIQAN